MPKKLHISSRKMNCDFELTKGFKNTILPWQQVLAEFQNSILNFLIMFVIAIHIFVVSLNVQISTCATSISPKKILGI